jgi:CheY-like chemotaxis protein
MKMTTTKMRMGAKLLPNKAHSQTNRQEQDMDEEKILFVDDDPNLLISYKRQLRNIFNVETAVGGPEGLEIMKENGPFAVVVADMRMPGMDGIEFLAKQKRLYPDTVGMMLTGFANLEVAIHAVNEGKIFRFLTKPCDKDTLISVLQAALVQNHLLIAERELQERTLRGAVWVLVEIMSLVNPTAFSRATRVRNYVRKIIQELNIQDAWRYEVAAMLSQIGSVTLPSTLIDKVQAGRNLSQDELGMYEAHPLEGARLLANIPRLEIIAQMISGQMTGEIDASVRTGTLDDQRSASEGARMLKTCLDIEMRVARGQMFVDAIKEMSNEALEEEQVYLKILKDLDEQQVKAQSRSITMSELAVGMTAGEDIYAKNDLLLLPRGQKVTHTVLTRMRNFAVGVGINEPFTMQMPENEEYDRAA